ncbi:MAG TPA: hypothetical protein VL945_00900 [Candidatus Saccharimonadales bacterium]|nr:hypothetical protein [Candidatus Saccharimonadales bacterium]
MSITGVVSESFGIIKKNPIVVLPYFAFLIVAVIGGVLFGLSLVSHLSNNAAIAALASQTTITKAMLRGLVGLFLSVLPAFSVFLVIISIVALFFVGAYISLAKQIYGKKKPSLGAAFSESASRFPSLLGALIIYTVTLAVIGLILLGAALLVSFSNLAAIALLALIGIILAIILGVLFFQAYTLVVIEGKRAVDAVKASIMIGRQRFWTIVGIGIVVVILAFATDILRIIPLIGWILGFIGSSIIAIMEFFIPPVFYYTYVKKETKATPAPSKKRKRR